MPEYPDGMTYLDLVKKHITDADDSYADHILWDKTEFPFVKDPKILEKQIVEFAKGIK